MLTTPILYDMTNLQERTVVITTKCNACCQTDLKLEYLGPKIEYYSVIQLKL